jgi:adenylate cyclase
VEYSLYLEIMGRVDEAVAHIDRIVSLDPFNADVHMFRAVDLVFARRYDEAIAEARNALAIEPGDWPALSALLTAQLGKGMDQEAFSTWKEYLKNTCLPDADVLMDEGFSEGGFKEALRRAAVALGEQVAKGGEGSRIDVAWLYVCAGDKSRALDWLEKGYEVRDPNMVFIGIDPSWDPVRSEPRFRALVEKMRLPVG